MIISTDAIAPVRAISQSTLKQDKIDKMHSSYLFPIVCPPPPLLLLKKQFNKT
jgi:hypothetical protein